jgi:biopolymer transport protein TolR
MRAPTLRTRTSLEFNMTPMIDVTFQLIIFFMLAGQLTRQETQVDLDLPGASQGKKLNQTPPRLVTVNVTRDGAVLLGGEQVDSGEFRRRIGVEVQRGEGELEVRIRADRTVPYKVVEPLLSGCAQSGVWNVGFTVVREGD